MFTTPQSTDRTSPRLPMAGERFEITAIGGDGVTADAAAAGQSPPQRGRSQVISY